MITSPIGKRGALGKICLAQKMAYCLARSKFRAVNNEARSRSIDTKAMLDFVIERRNRRMMMVLVRDTNRADGTGVALSHMFASDTHPEAVGPLLAIRAEQE